MIVVAKMYVASVITTADAFSDRVRSHVNLNCVYSPDPKTENHSFWKASPSGTLKIGFPPGIQVPDQFTGGNCFKLYHSLSENGNWRIVQNSIDDGRMTLKLSYQKGLSTEYWRDIIATEEMSIDNKDVFPFYTDSQSRFDVVFVQVDKEGNEIGDRFSL